jgi:hypothetical protein
MQLEDGLQKLTTNQKELNKKLRPKGNLSAIGLEAESYIHLTFGEDPMIHLLALPFNGKVKHKTIAQFIVVLNGIECFIFINCHFFFCKTVLGPFTFTQSFSLGDFGTSIISGRCAFHWNQPQRTVSSESTQSSAASLPCGPDSRPQTRKKRL